MRTQKWTPAIYLDQQKIQLVSKKKSMSYEIYDCKDTKYMTIKIII